MEEERFDYIPKAVASLRYNLRAGGSYIPPAWWVGSLGDHILYILFHLFERFRRERDIEFEAFADDWLAASEWGDQKYLMRHVYTIALRVHEELHGEPS